MPQRAAQCFHFPFPPAIASSSSSSQSPSPSPSQLWHSLRLICRSRRRVEMSKTNASTPNFHLVNVWKCCRKNYLVVENVHILVHTTVISLSYTHTHMCIGGIIITCIYQFVMLIFVWQFIFRLRHVLDSSLSLTLTSLLSLSLPSSCLLVSCLYF